MLTEGDRMQLAPHITKIRAARVALAKAVRRADEAAKRVVEQRKNTGFLALLFNRADAYREAQKALAEATEVVAARRQLVRSLNSGFDDVIRDMMPRISRRYELGTLTIECCAHAARECRTARPRIEVLVQTVRTAIPASADGRAKKDAGAARSSYPGHLAGARRAAHAVKLAVDAANLAMATAGNRKRLNWDDALLDGLPDIAVTVPARRRLAAGLPRLQAMPLRLDRLRKELGTVQHEIAKEQEGARIEARRRLVRQRGG